MAESFRFLINIDQCLNMAQYDMFFYMLENRHLFHHSDVRLFCNGRAVQDSQDITLRDAAAEIRMYLNRHADIADYQIILAMRTDYRCGNDTWENTLLFRLLRIHAELQRAGIYVVSREETERAVNLFMFYNADFTNNLPQLDDYMSGGRFMRDCEFLFRETGLDWSREISPEEWGEALKRYAAEESCDPDLLELFMAYARSRAQHDDLDEEEAEADEEENIRHGEQPFFLSFLNERLQNYIVTEIQVDRNSEPQRIKCQLRLVDYINKSTEPRPGRERGRDARSLKQRCLDNWQEILRDQTILQRYSDMLCAYEKRLYQAESLLETGGIGQDETRPLPPKPKTGDPAIKGQKQEQDEAEPQKKTIDDLLGNYARILGQKPEQWSDIYPALRKIISGMESELKNYAARLSDEYVRVLEQRKLETHTWATESFTVDSYTREEHALAIDERSDLLSRLEQTYLGSAFGLQDQLNMENALEQCNLNISFNLRCIRQIRISAFFSLLLVLILLFLAHYGVMQPYVFQDSSMLPFSLLYVAAFLMLMLLCYGLPRRFFLRRIRRDLKQLEESKDLYIKGYKEKKQNFLNYINLLNQIDSINDYIHLVERVTGETQKKEKLLLWHRFQIRKHLDKIRFFHGLTDQKTAAGNTVADDVSDRELSELRDVVDSRLYWPQG